MDAAAELTWMYLQRPEEYTNFSWAKAPSYEKYNPALPNLS